MHKGVESALQVASAIRRPWQNRAFRPPRRVLIIKPCCVGDVLLATPTLAAFQRAFPSAQFDWLVGAHARPMLINNPRVHALVESGNVLGGGTYTWREFLALAQQLHHRRYDTAIVLERSPLLGLLAWLAGIPQRLGLDSAGRGLFHTHTAPVPITPRHEAELYLDVARAVGVPTEGVRTEFYPTEQARRRIQILLGETRPIVIHPAGGENPGMVLLSKRWPAARFAAVARHFAEGGHRVVVIGGPNDRGLAAEVAGTWAESLAGTLSWDETGALLERAALFIGNDTGAMHLAAACGAPVVAIFGPSDPTRYAPYTPHSRVLWHRVGCNPCFEQGRARPDCCPNRAIEAVSVEEVLTAATQLLNAHSA